MERILKTTHAVYKNESASMYKARSAVLAKRLEANDDIAAATPARTENTSAAIGAVP